MSYVFDSSSLIYLGKLKILEKLKEKEKLIPEEVYKEVVTSGFKRNEPESYYIEKLIKNNEFMVKKAKINIINALLLSEADKEVLSLTRETNSTAIIDEDYAKQLAISLGIESHGSIYLIIQLLNKKIITKKQAINYIEKIIELGFYLSPIKYKEILKIIENM